MNNIDNMVDLASPFNQQDQNAKCRGAPYQITISSTDASTKNQSIKKISNKTDPNSSDYK